MEMPLKKFESWLVDVDSGAGSLDMMVRTETIVWKGNFGMFLLTVDVALPLALLPGRNSLLISCDPSPACVDVFTGGTTKTGS